MRRCTCGKPTSTKSTYTKATFNDIGLTERLGYLTIQLYEFVEGKYKRKASNVTEEDDVIVKTLLAPKNESIETLKDIIH